MYFNALFPKKWTEIVFREKERTYKSVNSYFNYSTSIISNLHRCDVYAENCIVYRTLDKSPGSKKKYVVTSFL